MQIRLLLGLLVFPFLLTAQNAITNQHLFDTIPFLPEHYEERVVLFEKEEVIAGKIIFLGNSITEGGNWQKLIGDNSVINRGIGGDITFGLLKRINDVIKRQPSKLFILIGINDIGKDIPETVIADNYQKMIAKVQVESPSTKIFIQSILPLNNTVIGFPQHYNKPDKVLKTNYLLKILSSLMHCTYVDLYPLFLDAKKRLDEKYTPDGLHLKPEGYDIWVKYLKAKKYL
jgi:lysophospholipase L1-like esterase